MMFKNIYISTFTTFELIRILWSKYAEFKNTKSWEIIKRHNLKREMDKIIAGFLSREITTQSDAIMNLITGLGKTADKLIAPSDLKVMNDSIYIIICYTSAERYRSGSVRYDAKTKTFTVDIDPSHNTRDGFNFTITFGQKAPTHIMKIWRTTIVKLIEETYKKIIMRIIESEAFY